MVPRNDHHPHHRSLGHPLQKQIVTHTDQMYQNQYLPLEPSLPWTNLSLVILSTGCLTSLVENGLYDNETPGSLVGIACCAEPDPP